MQNVLEQGPDFWHWFDTTQFSYHCVQAIHAKVFSTQLLLHFSQIASRVCTLVFFIIHVMIIKNKNYYLLIIFSELRTFLSYGRCPVPWFLDK